MYTLLKNNYEDLRNAVVYQAVQDYRRALQEKRQDKIDEVENFFLGESFCFWTKLDGKTIMKRVRRDHGFS